MTNIIGYNAYITYVALKNHFKSEKFNYFRHKGAKITEGSLKKHRDRYWFIKLQEKYSDEELLDFLIAQFTANHLHQYWVGDSFGEVCQNLHTERKKRMSKLTRVANLEIQYLYESFDREQIYQVSSGYPKIITAYLGGKICLETMIILNDINGWIDQTDALVGIVGAPLAMKLKKYSPFLNYNIEPILKKYKNIV